MSPGAHVVFDPVGGSLFDAAMKCVCWGARYLIIGFASGTIPKVAANILLVKNTTLHGIFWGSYLENCPMVISLQDSIWGCSSYEKDTLIALLHS
jgi:NADPH:quinone reductase